MFIASAIDLEPTQMSAADLLARLATPGAWSEASVYPPEADFPRLGIEVHPGIGVSILCHEDERSIGFLAATQESLSPPRVLVNLGGQVIERWPVELFLSETDAHAVVEHFLESGRQAPEYAWIRLDRFPRDTVYEGSDLLSRWRELTFGTGQRPS